MIEDLAMYVYENERKSFLENVEIDPQLEDELNELFSDFSKASYQDKLVFIKSHIPDEGDSLFVKAIRALWEVEEGPVVNAITTPSDNESVHKFFTDWVDNISTHEEEPKDYVLTAEELIANIRESEGMPEDQIDMLEKKIKGCVITNVELVQS